MLLVAQRVVSVAHRVQGVNSFRYVHRDIPWLPDPAAMFDEPKRTLVSRNIQLPPGGNRVISFLDVVAPDETDVADLLRFLNEFLNQAQPLEFPACRVSGSLAARFGIGRDMVPAWRDEIQDLIQHLLISPPVPQP